jgi:hypothetical protein
MVAWLEVASLDPPSETSPVPRSIQLTVPSHRTASLLTELKSLEPLSLRLHEAVSLRPSGDLVVLEVANNQLSPVMQIADKYGLGKPDGVSMSTSVPLSVVSESFTGLTREQGRTSWEELELTMGQESTMTADKVVVMFIAGVIAGAGIVSGAIHVVIGAMVIAPGFQPFARFMLGLVNGSKTWRGGAIDVLRGYGALLAGSTVAAVISVLLGTSALNGGGEATYLLSDDLVTYWSTITWTGVTVGVVAGVAGGLLMAINRTVLTAGVMVALALVPTAALVPMALVAGDVPLAGQALARFTVEVVLVLATIAGVFLLKTRTDKRHSVR